MFVENLEISISVNGRWANFVNVDCFRKSINSLTRPIRTDFEPCGVSRSNDIKKKTRLQGYCFSSRRECTDGGLPKMNNDHIFFCYFVRTVFLAAYQKNGYDVINADKRCTKR